ncbi:hypothetical protein L208DRAFT_1396002, partial [Tricholoma matsutake]
FINLNWQAVSTTSSYESDVRVTDIKKVHLSWLAFREGGLAIALALTEKLDDIMATISLPPLHS